VLRRTSDVRNRGCRSVKTRDESHYMWSLALDLEAPCRSPVQSDHRATSNCICSQLRAALRALTSSSLLTSPYFDKSGIMDRPASDLTPKFAPFIGMVRLCCPLEPRHLEMQLTICPSPGRHRQRHDLRMYVTIQHPTSKHSSLLSYRSPSHQTVDANTVLPRQAWAQPTAPPNPASASPAWAPSART